jgi:hypothetical protein
MQKGHIFLLRFPCHIKDITHNGDGSYHSIKADMGRHPEDNSFRHAQSHGLIQNIGGQEHTCNIASPRDQAREAIEPNPTVAWASLLPCARARPIPTLLRRVGCSSRAQSLAAWVMDTACGVLPR